LKDSKESEKSEFVMKFIEHGNFDGKNGKLKRMLKDFKVN